MTATVTPITAHADREARRNERRQAALKASIERAGREALRAVPTAAITARGSELARLLSRYIGESETIQRTCSLIARLATRHCRICEMECSVEMSEREAERTSAESDRIESRVRALVASLPPRVDGGDPLVAVFQGDPRGFTVKVHVPGREQDGNTWGLGGDFGV